MFADQKLNYLSGNRPRMAFGKKSLMSQRKNRLLNCQFKARDEKKDLMNKGESYNYLKSYFVQISITAIIALMVLKWIGF